MKKSLLFVLGTILVSSVSILAQTTHTITAGGGVYNPSSITVNDGDIIQVIASPSHPTTEVDQTSWNNNQTNTSFGGFITSSTTTTNTTVDVNVMLPGTHYFVCDNHVGSGMKGTIIVNDPAASIDESSSIKGKIYPNPCKDELRVEYDFGQSSEVIMTIKDVTGKEAYRLELSGVSSLRRTITLPGELGAGVYIMTLQVDNKNVTTKFSKE